MAKTGCSATLVTLIVKGSDVTFAGFPLSVTVTINLYSFCGASLSSGNSKSGAFLKVSTPVVGLIVNRPLS